MQETGAFSIGNVKRKATYVRLMATKKLGFIGALALLFNAATGPGLPYTPANFQSPGWVVTLLCFLLFAFVSGFSILFIVEAMQAIPGNTHFQGDVEYATLINFYFGPWAHIAGQMVLYGALQSNAIQGIVLSAQAIDNMFVDIFGKTCALVLSGSNKGWVCVATHSPDGYPSPFGNNWILFSLGVLVVIMLAVPLGLTNLDDNMGVQYGAFVLSFVMVAQWMSTSFVVGFQPERIVAAVPPSLVYGQVVGTVMLNLAITTIIPSWINIKRKDVNVQHSVWLTIFITTAFYIIPSFILAGGYDSINNNVLATLIHSGMPSILTKVFVYIFAFVMLIPSIPVNLIISKENLFQNQIVSERAAMFLSFILPWVVVFPLQTGNSLLSFQTWTSSLFVSTSNFIVPVIIYFRCVEFRTKYNVDRQLSDKQIDLLTRIHKNSTSLVKHLGRKRGMSKPAAPTQPATVIVEAPTLNIIAPDVTSRTNLNVVELQTDTIIPETQIDLIPDGSARPSEVTAEALSAILSQNVPDPDKEDKDAGRFDSINQPSIVTSVARLATTMVRRATRAPMRNRGHSEETPLENIEIDVLPPPNNNLSAPRSLHFNPSQNSLAPSSSDGSGGGERPAIVESVNPSESTMKEAPSDHSLLGVPSIDFGFGGGPLNNSIGRSLARLKTLPTHPNFKAPAFRSVPKWMPIRGYHMAWVVLILTSVVTLLNIIINIIPQPSPAN